jgi:hypothetical protein
MKVEWISVNDRLPEIGDKVLIYCSSQGQLIAYLSYEKQWIHVFDGSYLYLNITHWMPLPEPPSK